MAHQNEHDLRCIIGVRDGDRRSLEELYTRHTPVLYSLARRILDDDGDAQDALQDSWVQVWRSAGRFDPRRGPVAAWLVTITRSRALDGRRNPATRRRAEPLGEVASTDPPADTSASAVHRERHEHVSRAFAELTDRQREVLELAYFEGRTQREIADLMKVPLGTVKSWTRQGLLRFKAILPGTGLS